MTIPTETDLKELLLKVAWAECDTRMSGPDGPAFMFCAHGYPEAPAGCGDNEEEAAIDFIRNMYE